MGVILGIEGIMTNEQLKALADFEQGMADRLRIEQERLDADLVRKAIGMVEWNDRRNRNLEQ